MIESPVKSALVAFEPKTGGSLGRQVIGAAEAMPADEQVRAASALRQTARADFGVQM